MKIITLIPFFREKHELMAACLENVASYADGAAICVNDFYDAATDAFLRSFPIVKSIAYVAKDGPYSEPIYLSSLVTMAQTLQADWVVRQDADEVFESRVVQVRALLAQSRFDVLFALWPNCIGDETHHFYCHTSFEVGLLKPVFYKFDCSRLAVPSHLAHVQLKLHGETPGVTDVRLLHKKSLKSDQEFYVVLVDAGRLTLGETEAVAFEAHTAEAFEAGKDKSAPTYIKRDLQASLYLAQSFTGDAGQTDLPVTVTDRAVFTRKDLGDYLERLYPGQDARTRLHKERVEMSAATAIRREVVSTVKRMPWLRRLRERGRKPK